MNNTITKAFHKGILWTGIQTMGSKLIGIVTQLILAWLLLPEDFGKVSLVTSLTSIIFLIQALGLSDVLVSRGHMFFKILNLAKSFAFVTSIICFVLTIFIGILGGIVYDDITITYLVLIFAICVPFNAMSVVADAKLRIDLRFKQLSLLMVVQLILTNSLIIVFVLLKLGVYSFIIAPVLVSILRYIVIHKLARVDFLFSWTLNHYKYLLNNSIWGFLHNLFQTIIRQSDYLIIGFFVSTQAVGIYFMGYSLSVQVIALLVGALGPVFFPVLKTIPKSEINTIKNILIKIITIFSLFGMPFSFLQATLAEPLVNIFLEEKWTASIQIVQILSIGIGFNVTASVWQVALVWQNDFKKQAVLSLQAAIVFVLTIAFATYYFGLIGTACAATLFQIIFSLYYLNVSLKSFEIEFKKILNIMFKYFIISSCIFLFCYAFTIYFSFNNWLSIITCGILPFTAYFLYLYNFDLPSKELLIRLYLRIRKNGK